MTPDSLPENPDAFYQTLVENAAEGMLTIDADSTIVYANPAVEEILGHAPEELVGSSKMKIIPERLRPVHAAALESYVDTGERNINWDGIELSALHKDGHEVPTLISLREHTHDGERYFTGIIRDITERKQREQQLHDQRERLDQFADILAHDIRNPLSVAQGYTELAQQDYGHPELDDIAQALSRIEELVADVLVLSKGGKDIGDVEPVVVTESARQAWKTVETHDATLDIEGDLGRIEADESRFRELLGNVFRNAVEHGGSDVTVRIGRLPATDGLYIADDGTGLAPEAQHHLFEYGYSTQSQGTGYGLSIVNQIADAHGWSITAGNVTDGGARFEITGIEFLE